MCSSSSSKMKKQPAEEPLKNVDADMARAGSDASRQQALRRGLASTWTRYTSAQGQAAGGDTAAIAAKSDTLGG